MYIILTKLYDKYKNQFLTTTMIKIIVSTKPVNRKRNKLRLFEL